MRFGVREICNVVLKAKAAQKIGKKIFYKDEPVMYFDTLKTSSMETQSSTVYAQGGRGNPRLVAWEGERTVTFQMEDALISPEGLSILSGAGLIAASENKAIYQHVTEVIDVSDLDFGPLNATTYTKKNGDKWYIDNTLIYEKENGNWKKIVNSPPVELTPEQLESSSSTIVFSEDSYYGFKNGILRVPLSQEPYAPNAMDGNFIHLMFMKDGEIITEPYIPVHGDYVALSNVNGVKRSSAIVGETNASFKNEIWYTKGFKSLITVADHDNYVLPSSHADVKENNGIHSYTRVDGGVPNEMSNVNSANEIGTSYDVREFPFIVHNGAVILNFDSVFVDYYVERTEGATQIEITADKFGGNYYLEAETLFRTQEGLDMPAEFVIPNCKVQSNFTFSMANTGDPSTFTFTMDAFPDYTRFDHTHKVFAAIQIIEDIEKEDLHRHSTSHEPAHDDLDWF